MDQPDARLVSLFRSSPLGELVSLFAHPLTCLLTPMRPPLQASRCTRLEPVFRALYVRGQLWGSQLAESR